jgi:hypothetical protein
LIREINSAFVCGVVPISRDALIVIGRLRISLRRDPGDTLRASGSPSVTGKPGT